MYDESVCYERVYGERVCYERIYYEGCVVRGCTHRCLPNYDSCGSERG